MATPLLLPHSVTKKPCRLSNGYTYTGDWVRKITCQVKHDRDKHTLECPGQDMPHGKGRWIKTTAAGTEKYKGEFFMGNAHGKGKLEFPNGCVWKGFVEKNQMHGKGCCSLPDGQFTGEAEKGELHQGVFEYSHGFMRYEGEFKNGQPHGRGKMIYKKEFGEGYKQYVGQFKKGMFHGVGSMTYWDGKVDVNAKWIDDEQVQSGRASDEIEFEISETHDKSQKKKCRYKGDLNSDGLPEGKGRLQIFSANFSTKRGEPLLESTYTGELADGRKHGFGRQVYSNGNEFEGNFDGGNCEGYGEWRYWATDFERKHGKERLNVYKGNWKDNREYGAGELCYYDQVRECRIRVRGHFFGPRNVTNMLVTREDTGATLYEGCWFDGRQTGPAACVFDNDRYEGLYLDNKLWGPCRVQHDSGNVSFSVMHSDMHHGPTMMFRKLPSLSDSPIKAKLEEGVSGVGGAGSAADSGSGAASEQDALTVADGSAHGSGSLAASSLPSSEQLRYEVTEGIYDRGEVRYRVVREDSGGAPPALESVDLVHDNGGLTDLLMDGDVSITGSSSSGSGAGSASPGGSGFGSGSGFGLEFKGSDSDGGRRTEAASGLFPGGSNSGAGAGSAGPASMEVEVIGDDSESDDDAATQEAAPPPRSVRAMFSALPSPESPASPPRKQQQVSPQGKKRRGKGGSDDGDGSSGSGGVNSGTRSEWWDLDTDLDSYVRGAGVQLLDLSKEVDKRVAAGCCSFAATGSLPYRHKGAQCQTCSDLLGREIFVCLVCGESACHKGHEMGKIRADRFYCDCGAFACGTPCQSLPRMLASAAAIDASSSGEAGGLSSADSGSSGESKAEKPASPLPPQHPPYEPVVITWTPTQADLPRPLAALFLKKNKIAAMFRAQLSPVSVDFASTTSQPARFASLLPASPLPVGDSAAAAASAASGAASSSSPGGTAAAIASASGSPAATAAGGNSASLSRSSSGSSALKAVKPASGSVPQSSRSLFADGESTAGAAGRVKSKSKKSKPKASGRPLRSRASPAKPPSAVSAGDDDGDASDQGNDDEDEDGDVEMTAATARTPPRSKAKSPAKPKAKAAGQGKGKGRKRTRAEAKAEEEQLRQQSPSKSAVFVKSEPGAGSSSAAGGASADPVFAAEVKVKPEPGSQQKQQQTDASSPPAKRRRLDGAGAAAASPGGTPVVIDLVDGDDDADETATGAAKQARLAAEAAAAAASPDKRAATAPASTASPASADVLRFLYKVDAEAKSYLRGSVPRAQLRSLAALVEAVRGACGEAAAGTRRQLSYFDEEFGAEVLLVSLDELPDKPKLWLHD